VNDVAGKIYDITMPIFEGMPVYKNKPEKQPKFETTSDFGTGSSHETRIHIDVHTGTHIDAPLHMIPDGKTIESIQIDQLLRPCRVLDLTSVTDAIHKSDLEPLSLSAGDFVLLKTKNSSYDTFQVDFVFVAEDAAEYLASIGVAGVGIDALGIERSQPEHPTHTRLMGAGAVIIEGLRLQDVPAGEYLMMALPLRLIGLDAAPARVVLRELN
jgi:arylformamidase